MFGAKMYLSWSWTKIKDVEFYQNEKSAEILVLFTGQILFEAR